MTGTTEFEGFSEKTFKFFKDLEKNNNTRWFKAHRSDYENHLVLPAKSFVTVIAPFFNQLNPAIRTEPKFNKTLMRMNKDMRFAKGPPYRTYFLIHFGRFKMDSEFYLYLDKNGLTYGIFLNKSGGDDLYFKQNLDTYQKDIIGVFNEYKLNNKFALFSFDKDMELLHNRFNINRHFGSLTEIKFMLFEKSILSTDKIATSKNLVTRLIKTFSQLYPLYCFTISPDPLKLIDQFEQTMGVAR